MRSVAIVVLTSVMFASPTAPPPTFDVDDRPDDGFTTGEAAPAGDALGHDEAMRIDAAHLAETVGQSEPAALRALRFQDRIARLKASLPSDVLARSYAGSALTLFPRPRADLYFAGPVPDVIEHHVESSGVDGVHLRGGMRYTLDELARGASEVLTVAEEFGFAQVTSGINVQTQQITIEVVHPGLDTGLRGEALTNAVRARAAGRGIALNDSDLMVVEHPAGTVLVDLRHGYGGAGVRDDGVRECTSAFVVRRTSDGAEGPLTAAHCEGINQIEENNTSGGVNLTFAAPFVDEHIGTYGDVEWHTTVGHDDFPQFWSNWGTLRWTEQRAAATDYDQNMYLCKFGRAGGYACGWISDSYFEYSFTWGGCSCTVRAKNLVRVKMEKLGVDSVINGDSGGPWFGGTTAFGITSGSTGAARDEQEYAYFSRTTNVGAAFGVSIQLR